MNAKIIDDKERKFIGVSTRTTNAAESDTLTAKIPELWQRYFQVAESIPNKKDVAAILGIYTDYESDHTGEYTLIVASEVEDTGDLPEYLVAGKIPAARYLVFPAEGEMPAALIETWRLIWRFFTNSDDFRRAYTSDFEVHRVDDQSRVDVYIAIK